MASQGTSVLAAFLGYVPLDLASFPDLLPDILYLTAKIRSGRRPGNNLSMPH